MNALYVPSKKELRGPPSMMDLTGVISELIPDRDDPTLFKTNIEEPGVHIPTVLATCEIMLAKMKQMFGWDSKLNVTANGITVELRMTKEQANRIIDYRPRPRITHWERTFHELCEERSRIYRETDAYKKAEAERVAAAAVDQLKIDQLIATFPKGGHENEILLWVIAFSAINDNNRLTFDHLHVANLLLQEGYHRHDSVLTDDQQDAGEKLSQSLHGRWAIGQAIDHLLIGMPIHPVIGYKAQQFLDGMKHIEGNPA